MPTKAAYRDFEEDPEHDFEFFLADRLHMTVGRLRAEMSQAEFGRWYVWHGRRIQQEELAASTGGG